MSSVGRFEALVHFLVHECREDPSRLGSVRLNKALWFTDMYAYQLYGESVTGEKYIKRQMGPVPKTILATLRELEHDGKIDIREPATRYEPRQYKSLREPDVSLIPERDRKLAKEILEFVCKFAANVISESTHEEVWESAAEGEEIPLFATIVTGRGVITEEVKQWAHSVVYEIESEQQATLVDAS